MKTTIEGGLLGYEWRIRLILCRGNIMSVTNYPPPCPKTNYFPAAKRDENSTLILVTHDTSCSALLWYTSIVPIDVGYAGGGNNTLSP